jgi:hypothetical protein
LFKNTHLLRYDHPSALQRTRVYAAFLRIARLASGCFFNSLRKLFFQQPADVPRGRA